MIWCLPNLPLGRSYLDLIRHPDPCLPRKTLPLLLDLLFVGQGEINSASGSCIERTMLLDMYSRDNLILAGDWVESFRHVMWLPAESRQRREARWWQRLGNMTLRGLLNRAIEQEGCWGSLIVLCTLRRKSGKLTWSEWSWYVELHKQLAVGPTDQRKVESWGSYEIWSES